MKYILLLFILTFSLSAQVKGIVKDSSTGESIPFVNIWVEHENIGTTTEMDGSFSITVNGKDKNLIFSALGYETKTLKQSEFMNVDLKPTLYELNEITVLKKKHTKFLEIGSVDNTIMQAYDNGPKVEAKYFPYKAKYKKTNFIKRVTIFTDCRIDSASIKIRFFSVDSLGNPGYELLNKDFIVTVKKGVIKYKFDVSDFNLIMPENGIFVAYEKLLISANRTPKGYQPYVLYNNVDRDFSFVFSGGKWTKLTNKENPLEPININEPAINLILTN
uniref:carboxypeptidase-like regulatory domain-containing protein n=1 Tax=Flavobacterium sp. TaxID=239 RepID=UPI00404B75E3